MKYFGKHLLKDKFVPALFVRIKHNKYEYTDEVYVDRKLLLHKRYDEYINTVKYKNTFYIKVNGYYAFNSNQKSKPLHIRFSKDFVLKWKYKMQFEKLFRIAKFNIPNDEEFSTIRKDVNYIYIDYFKNGFSHRLDGPASIIKHRYNKEPDREEWRWNKRNMTDAVNKWISENDIPHWSEWNDAHWIMFKLKFL